MEIGKITSDNIWRVKGQDYKSTGTCPSKINGKFRIKMDALGHTIEEVLFQK